MLPRQFARRNLRLAHLWLGLIGGAFLCVMAVSGGIVTLRPPLAEWMAPRTDTPHGCGRPVDWDRAERRIRAVTPQAINRIYAFGGTDPRFHVRIDTARPVIYDHVIYDACADAVLGTIDLAWMDWLIDLHHNLLAGRTGRLWAGGVGLALLVSALSGALLWLLGNARLTTAFRIQTSGSAVRVSRDSHRAAGLAVMSVLALEAYTGLWLCFPQGMRATLSPIVRIDDESRAARGPRPDASTPPVSLAAVMRSAQLALPDGAVREVRLPDGYGNAQIRMWRPGDFRSLGNNVVTVENVNARVLAVDLYEGKPAPARFAQAMSGLHYGEWGGAAFRWLYCAAGLSTLVLYVTGLIIWRGPRAGRVGVTAPAPALRSPSP